MPLSHFELKLFKPNKRDEFFGPRVKDHTLTNERITRYKTKTSQISIKFKCFARK